MPQEKISVYIDVTNLRKGALEFGFEIDYARFFGWLRQKYEHCSVFLFTGFIKRHAERYLHLQELGYNLVFKDTVSDSRGNVKGNCDAEMVLKIAMDFYENTFETCVIISGDDDFACIADFLKARSKLATIIAPHNKRCSILLKRLDAPIIYLNELYHKFSDQNEKAPDADSSA